MTSTLLIAPLAGSLVNFVNASFIVAGLLFIFALAGLSKFETSKKGNAYGILGMVIAIVATIVALVKLPGYSPGIHRFALHPDAYWRRFRRVEGR